MKNRVIRAFAIGLGLTAIFATTGLNASSFYSEKMTIPFEFRMGHHVYHAGEYRLEQEVGREIAFLVNLNTGERLQIFRANNDRKEGRARLVFERTEGSVRILKKVS